MTPLLCYMALNNSTVDHVQEFSSATVVNPCTSSSLLLANIKKKRFGGKGLDLGSVVAVKVYRSLTNNSTQLSVIHFNSFRMILINEHCVRFSKHQMCASLVFAILRVLHGRQNRGPLCLYDSYKTRNTPSSPAILHENKLFRSIFFLQNNLHI